MGSFGETADDGQASVSAAAAASSDGGSYDCNICLELAQDPVVTLCGHLFCWPCLYRWLISRANCKECPVCKSAVEEEKVIPIYGRGKGSTDPRTKAVPAFDIPNRPAGRRTDIPRNTTEQPAFQPFGFSLFTGPAASAQFGNITLSAGFGLFPFLFGFGFPDLANPFGGGGTSAQSSSSSSSSNAAAAAAAAASVRMTTSSSGGGENQNQNQEALLSRLLLFVGCFVVLCLFFF